MPLFRRSRDAEPDPADERPQTGPAPGKGDRTEVDPHNPRGQSGRGHTNGYITVDERINPELVHPQSHNTYDEMFRGDGDVKQVVQLVVNPVVAGTWVVDPFGGDEAEEQDQEIAEAVAWALFEHMSPNWVEHLSQFLPVLFRSGFVPGEFAWAPVKRDGKDLLVPKTIEIRLPRSVFRWHQTGQHLDAIEQYVIATTLGIGPGDLGGNAEPGAGQYAGSSTSGPLSVKIDAQNMVYYRVGAEGDNWEGTSLLRPAYKHWFLKDRIERIDAIAQEREAVGIPVVYPPLGATKGQLDDMERILSNLRTNEQGYIIMPGMKAGGGAAEGQGWMLELLGFDRNGSGRDPMPSLEYHGLKISAAFIAEFMKLGQGGGGSRATAQVQSDPFQTSIEALTGLIEAEAMRKIVAPMVAYNWGEKALARMPRLRMSLVDSTSLTQLADYVLKLTQVGALLPDAQLEEFLRLRADLPTQDADRDDENDDMVRRQIVGGNVVQTPAEEDAAAAAIEAAEKAAVDPLAPGAPAVPGRKPKNDPYGSNAGAGQHKGGKPAGSGLKRGGAAPKPGRQGAPGGAGAAGQNGANAQGGGQSFAATVGAYALSRPGRDLSWIETFDLDGLAQAMDAQGPTTAAALREHVLAAARGAHDAEALRLAAWEQLMGAYQLGQSQVAVELDRHSVVLERGDRMGTEGLTRRADMLARSIEATVAHTLALVDIEHGDDVRGIAEAEKAGMKMAERAGSYHGISALNLGRHETANALAKAEEGLRLGVVYESILDGARCPECSEADDGHARDLDDPVRLDRQPPNRHCHSLASGDNRCRCFERYELIDG